MSSERSIALSLVVRTRSDATVSAGACSATRSDGPPRPGSEHRARTHTRTPPGTAPAARSCGPLSAAWWQARTRRQARERFISDRRPAAHGLSRRGPVPHQRRAVAGLRGSRHRQAPGECRSCRRSGSRSVRGGDAVQIAQTQQLGSDGGALRLSEKAAVPRERRSSSGSAVRSRSPRVSAMPGRAAVGGQDRDRRACEVLTSQGAARRAAAASSGRR